MSLQVVLEFLFFFQAEDGIRDTSVTGVQTCALPISEGGVHQGAGYRLLPARLENALAPSARPAAHAQAVSERRRSAVLLREELPLAPPALGPDGGGLQREQPPDHAVLPGERRRHADLGGKPRRPRAARAARQGAGDGPSHAAGLRSRSRRAREPGALLRGRRPAARDVRFARPREVCEDERLEGPPGLRG